MKLPYFFFLFVSYYFHVNIYVDKLCLLGNPSTEWGARN